MDLTPDQRRRGVEEAFASLRLDGLKPTAAALQDAEDYIEGRRTLDEIIADVVARHTAS
ncbi:antitoxin VbhA family protein [Microbacterium hatanonis]|uniref:antitoxin VbhA family protein n=1 Tax=Microbacterium hatanonis TaxID=404366 RepID=UPI00164F2BDE|nr:antitoxin VbhA family protein [Microbacterium hatanonis]